jgi:hypothetical protein
MKQPSSLLQIHSINHSTIRTIVITWKVCSESIRETFAPRETLFTNPSIAIYPLTVGILGSITHDFPREPASAYCFTLRCWFPDFTTLGVCSQCTTTIVNHSYDECEYTIDFLEDTKYDSLIQFQRALQDILETNQQEDHLRPSASVWCENYVVD